MTTECTSTIIIIITFLADDTSVESKWQQDTQVLRPCQRTKKAVEYEFDVDTSCSCCAWDGPQKLEKKNWKSEGE